MFDPQGDAAREVFRSELEDVALEEKNDDTARFVRGTMLGLFICGIIYLTTAAIFLT